MKHTFYFLSLLLTIGALPSCNTDDDNDNDGNTAIWPDVTMNLTVTGDAEQTLNFTNLENASGDDNVTAVYDADAGIMAILGTGLGSYLWQVRALSGPVPSAGSLVVDDGTYVNGSNSFNDLESGSMNLTSVSFLHQTAGGKFYKISGSFNLVLTGTPGTVNISGNFLNVVLTVPN